MHLHTEHVSVPHRTKPLEISQLFSLPSYALGQGQLKTSRTDGKWGAPASLLQPGHRWRRSRAITPQLVLGERRPWQHLLPKAVSTRGWPKPFEVSCDGLELHQGPKAERQCATVSKTDILCQCHMGLNLRSVAC